MRTSPVICVYACVRACVRAYIGGWAIGGQLGMRKKTRKPYEQIYRYPYRISPIIHKYRRFGIGIVSFLKRDIDPPLTSISLQSIVSLSRADRGTIAISSQMT